MMFLYNVFITPLLYLFEVLFYVYTSLIQNPFTALIWLFVAAIIYKILNKINRDLFYSCIVMMLCVSYLTLYAFGIIFSNDIFLPFFTIVFLYEATTTAYTIAKKGFNKPTTISTKTYSLYLILMFLIFSLYLPLKIVNSDVAEFYTSVDLPDLLISVIETGLVFFVIYPLIIFKLFPTKRNLIFYITLLILTTSMVSLFTFKMPADTLMPTLKFEITNSFDFEQVEVFTDMLYILLCIFAIALILRFDLIKELSLFTISMILTYSVSCCFILYSLIDDITFYKTKRHNLSFVTNLSQTGKNVIILFMDRAGPAFFPYLRKENPHIADEFEGFIYYPYTIVFAGHTLYSTPSLLGGYEYTPDKLQNDTTRRAVDKHNESVSVLPEIFRRQGWNVNLFDIPYINYGDHNMPDLYHSNIKYADSAGWGGGRKFIQILRAFICRET